MLGKVGEVDEARRAVEDHFPTSREPTAAPHEKYAHKSPNRLQTFLHPPTPTPCDTRNTCIAGEGATLGGTGSSEVPLGKMDSVA